MNSASGQVAPLRQLANNWPAYQPRNNLGCLDQGELYPAVLVQVEVYAEFIGFNRWYRESLRQQAIGNRPQPDYRDAAWYQKKKAEFYAQPLADRLIATYHDLIYPGQPTERFDRYAAAEGRARELNQAS